ncbi:MAG: ABC transporter permease [Rhodothalassiaceae bacterium]
MLGQVSAVAMMSLRSIGQRVWLSLATVITIAIVVAVLLFFQAMYSGFRETVEGTGAEDVAIVLRTGSNAELNSVLGREEQRLIEQAPGVVGLDGAPLASSELYVIVDGRKRGGGAEVNLPLRGIAEAGQKLRDVELTQGRMFTPGRTELVVGRALVKEFQGFDLGSTVRLGQADWDIVGIFDAGGGIFESELWGDARLVQSLFNRGSGVQSVRLKLTDPGAIDQIRAYVAEDPRLSVDVETEQRYFAEQNQFTADLITRIGYPVAFAMALGSLAGALNAMYTSVASRRREIATLRAIGFNGFSAFVGTMSESVALAAIGGLLGAGAAFLLFDGISTSTLGGGFTQVVFSFQLDPSLFMNGVVLALAIGLIGGFFPALRAARIPLAAAFRDEG